MKIYDRRERDDRHFRNIGKETLQEVYENVESHYRRGSIGGTDYFTLTSLLYDAIHNERVATETCAGKKLEQGEKSRTCRQGIARRGQAVKQIYVAHPFGGEMKNVDKVQKIITELIHKHPDCTFYSPLHATGFFYNQLPYLDGMEHCFEALSRCDELWLTGNWRESRGCNMEYGFARAKGIPIKFITG